MSDTPLPTTRTPAYRGSDPFVFVSYSHRDEALVEREIELLTARGARIYYDEGIDPGREWPEELASAVENCSAFVFFITSQSIDSRVCRGELAVALQAERPVIPVQLDATELPAALRLQIGNRQAIIRSRFTETEYRERLTAAVLAFQNAPPTPNATRRSSNDTRPEDLQRSDRPDASPRSSRSPRRLR